MSGDAARSSTASHYAANFETVSAGFAEHEFYQVLLDNNIFHAPVEQWIGLILLTGGVSVFLLPRCVRSASRLGVYVTVVAICIALLPQVTWIPLLTTLIYTRTSYPYAVVIPHCIVAHASYRAARPYGSGSLQALVEAFFFYGFGGSIVADLLMGLPVTAVAHPRIVPCHVLGWLCIWYCPADWIYQAYQNNRRGGGTFRMALVAAEAVDAVTTPMGRIARAARELRNKTTAPLLAGILAGTGGAVLRLTLMGIGSWQETLQPAVDKTLGYSLVFWTVAVWSCEEQWWSQPDIHHCAAYNGSDLFRVVLVTVHVVWTLAADAGWVSGHFFPWIGHQIRYNVVTPLVVKAKLGSMVAESSDAKHERPKKD